MDCFQNSIIISHSSYTVPAQNQKVGTSLQELAAINSSSGNSSIGKF